MTADADVTYTTEEEVENQLVIDSSAPSETQLQEDIAAAAALVGDEEDGGRQLTSETVKHGEIFGGDSPPQSTEPIRTTEVTFESPLPRPVIEKQTSTRGSNSVEDVARHLDEVIDAVSKGEFSSNDLSPTTDPLSPPPKPAGRRKRQVTNSSSESVSAPPAKRKPNAEVIEEKPPAATNQRPSTDGKCRTSHDRGQMNTCGEICRCLVLEQYSAC